LFCIAAGAALFLAGCKPPGARALLRGERLIDKGNYREAIAQLTRATSILTTNAQAWNYLGLAYHHAGEAANADRAYQRALLLDNDLSEAHFNLGCLLLEQNKPESAKNELTAYVLRRGNFPEALAKLASADYRSHDYTGAERSFGALLKTNPNNPEALNGMGLVRYHQRRLRDSVQYFLAALKQNQGYAPAVLNLGIVSQASGDYHAAIQNYQQYLRLAPHAENAAAVNQLARDLEAALAASKRTAAPANPLRTGTVQRR
ncbi:MAG TPA: tetratricopeptide repeat protein, partial [Verrucomicrobiae bacterium]|nr:tetratricopeptide repeat protein [Verrucomicrobiae bacterium]